MIDINPYRLEPAGDYFIGHEDLLAAWRTRLSSTEDGRNWLVLASGGLGKTSLLQKLQGIAEKEFKALTVAIDFGAYRDRNNPAAFFEALENQLTASRDFGTLARDVFQISPDSPDYKIFLQLARGLLKISGLSNTLSPIFGAGSSLPDAKLDQPEDIAIRIARFLRALLAINERSHKRIVVLIDQLGKAHDNPLWCDMACLLLSAMLELHKKSIADIIFVVAMRPERFGLLDAQIQRQELFGDALFQRKYLKPFSIAEAERAICERNKDHFIGPMSSDLAKEIVKEVSLSGPLDPYAVIQASAAVWAYLYTGDTLRDPARLGQPEIHTVIKNFYTDLVRHFKQFPSIWSCLKLLTHYPAGLKVGEMVEHLNHPRHPVITSEVEQALSSLLNQRSYQLITVHSQKDDSPRYAIAHELLHEAILQQIPEEQRLEAQAQKTFEDAVWRWQHQGDLLSERELDVIYQYRHILRFSQLTWEAIAASLLNDWDEQYTPWLDYEGELIDQAIQSLLETELSPEATCRGITILAYHTNNLDLWGRALKIIVTQGREREGRNKALNAFMQIGDRQKIREVLSDLARQDPDWDVRRQATEGLARIGEPAREVLAELSRQAPDTSIRRQAAKGLAELGEMQIAREMLAELARQTPDKEIRWLAAEGLAELGYKGFCIGLFLTSPLDQLPEAFYEVFFTPEEPSVNQQ